MTATRRVVFVLFGELQLLDLAGPADVFRMATLLGADPGFELATASATDTLPPSVSDIDIGPEAATNWTTPDQYRQHSAPS